MKMEHLEMRKKSDYMKQDIPAMTPDVYNGKVYVSGCKGTLAQCSR